MVVRGEAKRKTVDSGVACREVVIDKRGWGMRRQPVGALREGTLRKQTLGRNRKRSGLEIRSYRN